MGAAKINLVENLPEGLGLRMLPLGDSVDVEPGRVVTVGLQPLPFHVTLVPAPAPDWVKKNVRVEGAEVQVAQSNTGAVSFTVPAASKEGTVTITLSSVVPPDGQGTTVTFTLNRKAEPHGTLQVLEGDTWRAVEPGEFLGQRPLDLRVAFSSEMAPDSLQAELAKHSGIFKWEDAKTLLWHPDTPPTVVALDLRQGRGTNGLLVMGSLASAYTGEAPHLVAFDLAREPTAPAPPPTSLTTLPADIQKALLSPDGQKLLVSAYLRSTSRSVNPPTVTLVIDTRDGSRRPMPGDDANYFNYLAWAGDKTLVALTYEQVTTQTVAGSPPLTQLEARIVVVDLSGNILRSWPLPGSDGQLLGVSPDGKRLAVMIGDGTRENWTDRLVPYDLSVLDLGSGQTTLVAKEFVWIYSAHSEGKGRNGPAWSPDGRRIAAVGDRKQGEGVYVRVIEVPAGSSTGSSSGATAGTTTGTATAAAATDAASIRDMGRSYQYPFSWSTDGRYWVVGDRIVSSEPPFDVKGRLSGVGKPLWSPNDSFVARGETDDYGVLHVYRERSGQASDLDADFPIGWDRSGKLYAIRWPDYKFRVIWQFPH